MKLTARTESLAARLLRTARVARAGFQLWCSTRCPPSGAGCAACRRARASSSTRPHERASRVVLALRARPARRHHQDVPGDRDALRPVPARLRRPAEAAPRRRAAEALRGGARGGRARARQAARRRVRALRRGADRLGVARAGARRAAARRPRGRGEGAVPGHRGDRARSTSRNLRRACRIYERFDPQPLELLPLLEELVEPHRARARLPARGGQRRARAAPLRGRRPRAQVPEIHREWSTRRVLVMERVGGHEGDRQGGARSPRASTRPTSCRT